MRTGVPERPLHIEHADLSLLGNRDENQDRVAVALSEDAAFLAVVDGMGGHAHGALAAEVAIRTMVGEFWEASRPLFDPDGFLHLTVGRAHESVVAIGRELAPDVRPRATCAVCLVQGGNAFWAHVGDSRVYLLRDGRIHERTRDHSHVELLLRSGRITERQAHDHPMRNYVECCLGGDPALPEMTLSGRRALKAGDLLLLCSDGLWSGVKDPQIAALGADRERGLQVALADLGARAVQVTAPFADNTTAAALRWYGA
ncbi:MAG: serine/threonine-protein phosphatase [Lysobacterales bacterium]|nr:MAG: serine/threonine-protein phosphatase [Xanthomonadales bacterium]